MASSILSSVFAAASKMKPARRTDGYQVGTKNKLYAQDRAFSVESPPGFAGMVIQFWARAILYKHLSLNRILRMPKKFWTPSSLVLFDEKFGR